MLDINNTIKYVEIETCSSCTRRCDWCLFGTTINNRPLKNEFLETKYIHKVINELINNKFEGTVALYSINEPLLDSRIRDGSLIRYIKEKSECEILVNLTTNGDLLDENIVFCLFENGLDKLIISCYDEKSLSKAKVLSNIGKSVIVLDQRRYNEGKWESNRAGILECDLENQYRDSPCYMPFFRTVIGWNGEVRLCPHDVIGKNKIGNIKNEDLYSILNGFYLSNIREKLSESRNNVEPCKYCNVDGSIKYMFNHLNSKIELRSVLKYVNGR